MAGFHRSRRESRCRCARPVTRVFNRLVKTASRMRERPRLPEGSTKSYRYVRRAAGVLWQPLFQRSRGHTAQHDLTDPRRGSVSLRRTMTSLSNTDRFLLSEETLRCAAAISAERGFPDNLIFERDLGHFAWKSTSPRPFRGHGGRGKPSQGWRLTRARVGPGPWPGRHSFEAGRFAGARNDPGRGPTRRRRTVAHGHRRRPWAGRT